MLEKALGADHADQNFRIRIADGLASRDHRRDFFGHAMASGHHCEIDAGEETVMVRDLGSTNGTFIDDQPISEGFP